MAGKREAPRWNPYPFIQYNGLYPKKELQQARSLLIKCLQNPRSSNLRRVMPKCGISSEYGPAHPPPPPLPPPSFPKQSPKVSSIEHTRSHIEEYSTSLHNHSFQEDVDDFSSPPSTSRTPLLPSPQEHYPDDRIMDSYSTSYGSNKNHLDSPNVYINDNINDTDYREYNHYDQNIDYSQETVSPKGRQILANDNEQNCNSYQNLVCDTETLKAILQSAAQLTTMNKKSDSSNTDPLPSNQVKLDSYRTSKSYDNHTSSDSKSIHSVLKNESNRIEKPPIPEFFTHKRMNDSHEMNNRTVLDDNAVVKSINQPTGDDLSDSDKLNFQTIPSECEGSSSDIMSNDECTNSVFSLPNRYESRNKIPFLSDSQSEDEEKDEPIKTNDSIGISIEKIRNFSIWKADSAFGEMPQGLEVIFKCDSCSFASKEGLSIKKHLKSQAHYSASTYKAVVEKNNIMLYSVHKMLVFSNESSVFKTQVIVCPECKDIFLDIFMCGVHSKRYHGCVNGMYSVSPVVSEEKYQFNCDICQHCQTQFSSLSELKSHWQNEPHHCPSHKLNKDAFHLYFCFACKTVIYNNLFSAISHIRMHERKDCKKGNAFKSKPNRDLGCCIVRQVHFSRVSHQVPMFEASDQNALWRELDVLKKMRHFYNTYHTSAKDHSRKTLQMYRELRVKLGCQPNEEEVEEEQDNQPDLKTKSRDAFPPGNNHLFNKW